MIYLLSFQYGDDRHTISGDAKSIFMITVLLGYDDIKFTVVDHYGIMIDTKKGIGMEYFDKPTTKDSNQ